MYTDFIKAFDKVNHQILLEKMDDKFFSDDLIGLFTSCLENRHQYVSYRGYESREFLFPWVYRKAHIGDLFFFSFL